MVCFVIKATQISLQSVVAELFLFDSLKLPNNYFKISIF